MAWYIHAYSIDRSYVDRIDSCVFTFAWLECIWGAELKQMEPGFEHRTDVRERSSDLGLDLIVMAMYGTALQPPLPPPQMVMVPPRTPCGWGGGGCD